MEEKNRFARIMVEELNVAIADPLQHPVFPIAFDDPGGVRDRI